jgi:Fe-S oxidoreductase
MPEGHVCCGRPLYDYGFLDMAERYLRRTLRTLRDEIREGTPIVGIEPSCLAVFKDELKNMLPHDDDAERLRRNAFHYTEFFQKKGLRVPTLDRSAVVWGHCHHKATGGMDPEIALLEKGMGLKVEKATGGCCGLAGSWGFEPGKYDLSMQCGEQGLFPAVRKADEDALIIANGFSCKTQLEQSGLGREALHVAEVMKMVRDLGPSAIRGPKPEQHRAEPPKPSLWVRVGRTSAALGVAALMTAVPALATKRRPRRRLLGFSM